MYLAIEKLNMGKLLVGKAKGGTSVVEILKKLLELLKPENLDLDSAEKAGERLALVEQDLIAIILFGEQNSLKMNDVKAMRYSNGLANPLDFEQIKF